MNADSDAAAPADRRRNNIGTLRMLGAMAVLFGHSFVLSDSPGPDDPLTSVVEDLTPYHLGMPGLGVAMFFAVSGFLVTQSFVRRHDLVAYVEARLLRIYPALIFAVALTLLLGALITTYGVGDYLTSKQTIAYGIHDSTLWDLRYLLPGVFTENPTPDVNGSLWTLPVELRMYVLVAIAGVLGVLGHRLAFNLVALALVVTFVIWPEAPLLSDPVQIRAGIFFLAGAALYVNRDRMRLTGAGAAGLAVVAAVASFTAAYPLAFSIAFAYAVLWIGFSPRIRMPDLAARGDLSYGTYLFAFPVTQLWIQIVGAGSSPWAIFLLTTATVLPLAALSWTLVERRALRLKGSLARIAPRARGSRPEPPRPDERSPGGHGGDRPSEADGIVARPAQAGSAAVSDSA